MEQTPSPPSVDAMALELAVDRIASLERDVVVYREIAQVAIHKLADLTRQRDRLREELRDLRADDRGSRYAAA